MIRRLKAYCVNMQDDESDALIDTFSDAQLETIVPMLWGQIKPFPVRRRPLPFCYLVQILYRYVKAHGRDPRSNDPIIPEAQDHIQRAYRSYLERQDSLDEQERGELEELRAQDEDEADSSNSDEEERDTYDEEYDRNRDEEKLVDADDDDDLPETITTVTHQWVGINVYYLNKMYSSTLLLPLVRRKTLREVMEMTLDIMHQDGVLYKVFRLPEVPDLDRVLNVSMQYRRDIKESEIQTRKWGDDTKFGILDKPISLSFHLLPEVFRKTFMEDLRPSNVVQVEVNLRHGSRRMSARVYMEKPSCPTVKSLTKQALDTIHQNHPNIDFPRIIRDACVLYFVNNHGKSRRFAHGPSRIRRLLSGQPFTDRDMLDKIIIQL